MALVMAGFQQLPGQRPIESPVRFEDRIEFTSRNSNGCISWCFQKCPSITLTGNATRVVGRGLVSHADISSDGVLQNPDKYTQDRVLDETATLHLILDPPVGDPSGWGHERPCREWSVSGRVKVNGIDINKPFAAHYCPKSGREKPQHLTVPIPAKHLRFAARNLNNVPTPAENTLEILHSASIYTLPGECDDHLSYSLNEAYIEFKAMAPVLAVHGCCGETESWFTGTDNDPKSGTLSDNENYPPPRIAEEFAARRAGFRTARFELSAESWKVSIKDGMPHYVEEVIKTLREFGSQTLNLAAHSKGGLRARHMLGSAEWRNTGVRSLVTIATPHYGSTVAEWVKAQQDSAERGEDIGRLLSWATDFAHREIGELTQQGVDAMINRPFSSPPKTFHVSGKDISTRYWTLGANADRNGDRILELGELENLAPASSGWIPGAPGATAAVATFAYRIAGLDKYIFTEKVTETRTICPPLQPPCRVSAVTVHRIREVPHNEPFRPNDVVVTRRSAAYRFREAKFYADASGQNHHSIGNFLLTGKDFYDLLRLVPK